MGKRNNVNFNTFKLFLSPPLKKKILQIKLYTNIVTVVHVRQSTKTVDSYRRCFSLENVCSYSFYTHNRRYVLCNTCLCTPMATVVS